MCIDISENIASFGIYDVITSSTLGGDTGHTNTMYSYIHIAKSEWDSEPEVLSLDLLSIIHDKYII